jgi:hypothetical protein
VDDEGLHFSKAAACAELETAATRG